MEQTMNMSALELGTAAEAAIAALAGLGSAERRRAMAALGWREPTRVWKSREIGAYPTLTEMVPGRDRDALYDSAAWAAYVRGPTVIAYLMQARGLGNLAADLGGVSLVKAGTAAKDQIDRRVCDLGRAEYGAWMRTADGYAREDGFKIFETSPRLQLVPQHPRSPVRLCSLGVEVDLPVGSSLTAERFEAALNTRLAPLRLHAFADTAAGRALCANTGVPPHRLRRYYRRGCVFAAATEITLMRPQADIGAFARACADIVIDATLGLLPARPPR